MADYPPVQFVDENDNPIGEGPLSEAHKKGIYYRGAHIYVEDTDGKLLLQLRGPDVFVPNKWDASAGGHVESGESYLEAAQKELGEELGLHDVEITQIGIAKYGGTYEERIMNRFVGVFRVVIPAGTPINFDPDEVADVRWFSLDEIRKLIANQPDELTSALKDDFKTYYENH